MYEVNGSILGRESGTTGSTLIYPRSRSIFIREAKRAFASIIPEYQKIPHHFLELKEKYREDRRKKIIFTKPTHPQRSEEENIPRR